MTEIGEKLCSLKKKRLIVSWMEATAKHNILNTILNNSLCEPDRTPNTKTSDLTFLLNEDFYQNNSRSPVRLPFLDNGGQMSLLKFYIAHIPVLPFVSHAYYSPFNYRFILKLPLDMFYNALQADGLKSTFLKLAINGLPYHRNNDIIMKIIGLLGGSSIGDLQNVLYSENIPEYLLNELPKQWDCYLNPLFKYKKIISEDITWDIRYNRFSDPIKKLVKVYKKTPIEDREPILAELFGLLDEKYERMI
jgi:hypothetical protein